MKMRFAFERGALDLTEIERLNAEIWADLAFDEAAKAALRRDGLPLDGLRLGGSNPYLVSADTETAVAIEAGDSPETQDLLDLWQMHFLRRIREARARQ